MSIMMDAKAFLIELKERFTISDIAGFCRISPFTVTQILNNPTYDMGSVNARKIISSRIVYCKIQKRIHDINALSELSEADGHRYKETRKIEPPRSLSMLSQMKGL